jgi:UDP-N-acetylglucosamine 4-epimerase
MKKIWLVTGAAGFIGSNLCESLLHQNFDVIGLDNYSTGKKSNIERISSIECGNFNFVEGDILDNKLVSKLCIMADVVVHLAAQGSVQKSFTDISYNNSQNIDGFINVLTSSGEAGIKNFIYASSCSVYGETGQLAVAESQCPKPMSPYAISKLYNDLLGFNIRKNYPKMIATGLRFFNIYGPYQDPEGDYAAVIPKWINLCMSGDNIKIFGDGSATRDFCHVDDVIELISKIPLIKENQAAGVFNIGSGKSTSLFELYSFIKKSLSIYGISVLFEKPEYFNWREGDILHSLSDINNAKRNILFKPKIDLLNGINNILTTQYITPQQIKTTI